MRMGFAGASQRPRRSYVPTIARNHANDNAYMPHNGDMITTMTTT